MSKRHPNVWVRVKSYQQSSDYAIISPQCSIKKPVAPRPPAVFDWVEYVPAEEVQVMIRAAVEADRASRSNAEVIWPEDGAQPEPVYKEPS